jgi:acetyl esterase
MGTKKSITHKQKQQLHKERKILRWGVGIVATIMGLVVLMYLATVVSPWPGSMLIRYEFNKGGQKTSDALEKYVPSGVSSVLNQQYANGKDTKLDAYYPSSTAANKALPTVVWVHGGAWVSGSKETVANYLKIVASHGYTVVGIDYSIAPEKHYPTPVLQTNDALRYIQQNASRLHVDPQHIVLAGDSAGSQIAAQVATIISNPAYAKETNISSPLPANQLKGVVLNCGAYDLALPNYNGPDGKFLQTVLWAYAGTKDFTHDRNIQHASVVDYANKDFPPAFITAGNIDPLETQSLEFAKKLSSLGVVTSTLFYSKDHQPQLQHEYQFNLDVADGQNALQQILDFLKAHA